MAEIPARSRSARNHQDRPVTPEVAGSSPVTPVQEAAAQAGFSFINVPLNPVLNRLWNVVWNSGQ
jgi:hypothetical protein